GAGPAGGDADADLAGGAGVALGGEAPALLVARQDGAQPVGDPGEGLVQGHAGPAGVGENDLDAVAEQALNEDVGPRQRRCGWCRFVAHSKTLPAGEEARPINLSL